MNFGLGDTGAFVFVLLAWLLPFVVAVWFIKTLSSIARSMNEIVERLDSLERALRDRPS